MDLSNKEAEIGDGDSKALFERSLEATVEEPTIKCMQNIVKRAPGAMIPTLEWQIKTVNEFTHFRKYIHSKVDTNISTIAWFDKKNYFLKFHCTTPLFSEITRYSQAGKIRMLEVISEHLASQKKGYKINVVTGAWLYGILTLLEMPLSADWCYTVREFGKKCLAIRAALDDEASEVDYNALNFFICIVARFYGQLDLADP